MANPDVASITANQFVQFGSEIFRKMVVAWRLREDGVQVRLNVNKPQTLTKLSAVGGPRPYAAGDNISGNGVKYTDRILTAYQSKWDMDFDPEEFRNTYLADLGTNNAFYADAMDQVSKEYLAALLTTTIYSGVRNGSGTAAADICNGFGTIIAAEITATNLTPIATGALTTANAVTKVEQLVEDAAFPLWLRNEGFIIYCSYATFDKYKTHYRTLNGFGFNAQPNGDYKLDNKMGILRPVVWMNTSGRLIATKANNLVVGTELEGITIAATARRNIIEVRPMMTLGTQIQDLAALVVNDQA